MDRISMTAVFGFLILILTSLVPSKDYLSRKYQRFEMSRLFHANSFSKKFSKQCLIIVFIVIPIVMAAILPRFDNGSAKEAMLSIFLLAIFFGISLSGTFLRISQITDLELKNRKK